MGLFNSIDTAIVQDDVTLGVCRPSNSRLHFEIETAFAAWDGKKI